MSLIKVSEGCNWLCIYNSLTLGVTQIQLDATANFKKHKNCFSSASFTDVGIKIIVVVAETDF